eukprot:TRINITY_DN21521_c0_g1_i1.p1 TRINITY_DN21521_c0_g1~~TRINITY_DN21521_c0_g1_i1.p1  ORF type:complete len:180 (-),score=15.70 TRINITY_DN21521_c0_g1_i1:84-569(-)
MTLLELAVSLFDYFFNFDFSSYQIDITSCGLQWKHEQDYNLNHSDQATMLIEDPSSKNENVTRCLKPHNLRTMKSELFRAYKCAKNGDWNLLFTPFDENGEQSIFEIYPATDQYEVEVRKDIECFDDDYELYEEYYSHSKKKQNKHHNHDAYKTKYKKKTK